MNDDFEGWRAYVEALRQQRPHKTCERLYKKYLEKHRSDLERTRGELAERAAATAPATARLIVNRISGKIHRAAPKSRRLTRCGRSPRGALFEKGSPSLINCAECTRLVR